MMPKIAAVALVAALVAIVNADALALHTTKVVHGAWELSRVQPQINLQERVDMNIGLKRRNLDVLEKVLLEVSDPKSPKYGEHLNDEQMRQLIGTKPESVAAVKAWLARHGITNVEVSKHMDSMKFKATRAQVSSLLQVQWAQYENAATKQRSIRALDASIIPAEFAETIEMVVGHRGWPMPPQPGRKVNKNEKKVADDKKWAFNPDVDVTPNTIFRTYNENSFPETPAGYSNVQAFFQAGGQAVEASDLTQFCSEYLSTPHGFNGSCTIGKYIGGQDPAEPTIESSLDSQYIIATSFGAETWAYTYSGGDLCADLLSWAQDVFNGEDGTHPNVISMSYGSQALPDVCDGQGAERLHQDTMKMGAAGISVLIASGDSGSAEISREGWNDGYLAASFPAELPYVTSVGSTVFISGNSGEERSTAFSGGGFSYNWQAPSYQKTDTSDYFSSGVTLPQDKYNQTGRGTPDVSFLGEGFKVIKGGQLAQQPYGVAGTSCSTPSFAGMVTLLNNVRLEQGKTLGFLNPLLYANTQAFTDITKGNNDLHNDGNGWIATSGWDPATGLGTPKFAKLVEVIRNLNGGGSPVPATPRPPTPPRTPNPVTPKPASSGDTFTQKVCQNSACTQGCQSHTFKQNVCLQVNGGGSAKASCNFLGLSLTSYSSSDCSGFGQTSEEPVNQCQQDTSGSYLENLCSNALLSADAPSTQKDALFVRAKK